MYAVADLAPPRYVLRHAAHEAFVPMETVLARAGFRIVAGADEAGRGACAGPLTAAACILPAGRRGQIAGLADSKLLTEATREQLYDEIVGRALAWQVVSIEPDEVDRIGLHVANLQAMRRAVRGLRIEPAYTLTDGFPVDGLSVPTLAVWKGDRVSCSIAAASILAKVTRDRRMRELARQFPEYGFDVHKGYGTAMHEQALREHGPSSQHRLRYANVRRHRVVNSQATWLDGPVEHALAEEATR
ncbi:ribonuclease HII [Blastococcus sp. Marseille-P5729]|uniref:ribonuclease HII n=1 Tax=Blastococcus sp. Marseille-P5729 TaxID=2086582 RepID=UPI001F36537D|nr:ribonuclease HII [Blastococcus sp. Marseille-P5729]